MITVLCTITVVYMHFFSKADVRGIVKRENLHAYIVDFSKDAKKQGFQGDYSYKIVKKTDCVEDNF